MAQPNPYPHAPPGAPAQAPAAPRAVARLWVERGAETYLGMGRVSLLERIRDRGSIAAAARSMGMGYRHAWDLVQQMNRLAPTLLVERATGGRGGGGSHLTPAGAQAIAQFRRAERELDNLLAAMVPPGIHVAPEAEGQTHAT